MIAPGVTTATVTQRDCKLSPALLAGMSFAARVVDIAWEMVVPREVCPV